MMSEQQCPICFECVDSQSNFSKTPCGHAFCFQCILKALETNNTCPLCRAELKPIPKRSRILRHNDDSSDEEESDDDETLESASEENESDDSPIIESDCDIEYLEKVLQEKGITYQNILSLLLNRFPESVSMDAQDELENKFYDIVDELDEDTSIEAMERLEMMKQEEDSRDAELKHFIKTDILDKIVDVIAV